MRAIKKADIQACFSFTADRDRRLTVIPYEVNAKRTIDLLSLKSSVLNWSKKSTWDCSNANFVGIITIEIKTLY
jgi:hypothetical protein